MSWFLELFCVSDLRLRVLFCIRNLDLTGTSLLFQLRVLCVKRREGCWVLV